MSNEKVIIVHLRRPRGKNAVRNDPFWEFGSFGITGCHDQNLLNPETHDKLTGVRLAFAQGGRRGTCLVFLTPPISSVAEYANRREALWSPRDMPFRYDFAPLLVDGRGKTDFPKLKKILRGVNRPSWVAKFASKFRARKSHLQDDAAKELIETYERRRKGASRDEIAENYVDALPVNGAKRETMSMSRNQRRDKYEYLREKAGRVRNAQRPCGSRRRIC